ncbi:hypothetical protein DOY81_014710, partial [Sarcophaga bullata]
MLIETYPIKQFQKPMVKAVMFSWSNDQLLLRKLHDDYGPQNEKLIAKIENGRSNNYRQTKAARKKQLEAMQKVDKMMAAGLMTPVTAPVLSTPNNSAKTTPIANGHYSPP